MRKNASSSYRRPFEELYTGKRVYRLLADKHGSDRAASEYLNSLGIPGLRYLDGGSRASGEGTHNYVIWDDKAVNILETYYQQRGKRARRHPAA